MGRFASKSEFGWDGAASAYLIIDPVEHIGVFYASHLRNCAWNRTYNPAMRDAIYEELRKEK